MHVLSGLGDEKWLFLAVARTWLSATTIDRSARAGYPYSGRNHTAYWSRMLSTGTERLCAFQQYCQLATKTALFSKQESRILSQQLKIVWMIFSQAIFSKLLQQIIFYPRIQFGMLIKNNHNIGILLKNKKVIPVLSNRTGLNAQELVGFHIIDEKATMFNRLYKKY